MADFLIADVLTSKTEGGYQCLQNDNGNWTGGKKGVGVLVGTKYGIAAPTMKAFIGRIPTVDDMKNMTPETAKAIRKANYWIPIKGDLINDQESANQIYDMAINAGVKTAITLCQRSLGMAETGIMTQETIGKLNNK